MSDCCGRMPVYASTADRAAEAYCGLISAYRLAGNRVDDACRRADLIVA